MINISGITAPAAETSEMSKINASSEVAINTAIIVPVRIKPLSYSLAAITEKPHCGISPVAEPMSGARFPCNIFWFWVRCVRCSRISISTYIRNRKGNTFKVSHSASSIISIKIPLFQAYSRTDCGN